MTILGFFCSSDDKATDDGVEKTSNPTNNDIEMSSLEEQPIETNKQDQILMGIICKTRRENDILNLHEIQTLKTSYEIYHETNVQLFYQYIRDFADYKSLELIMDQAWTFEKNLHRGKTNTVSNEIYSSGAAEQDVTIGSADDKDILQEAWEFDDLEHSITDYNAAAFLNENVSNEVLKAWIFQHIREERGAGYALEKQFHLKILKPLLPAWKKLKMYDNFFKGLMVTKSLLQGLVFSIICFLDAIKDIMLIFIIWHFSHKILVCFFKEL